MVFSELKKHLQTRNLYPAYFVSGEDAFLVSNALRMFRELSDPMRDFNLCELNSPESASAVVEACECLPLGSRYRVVIVTHFTVDASPLLKYLDNPNPSTVLVFYAPKPENNMAKAVSRFTVVDCTKLEQKMMMGWIATKTVEYGSSITTDAADRLIEYCAGDMSRISTELAKLCAYRYGGRIEGNDVTEQVVPTLDYKIYELSEAVATKNTLKAAKMLRSLTDEGVAPVQLLSMLYTHFRRLLYVAITPQYDRMTADLNVKSDYVIKKAKEQAGRYTPKKLKKICDDLMAADCDVKFGRMNDQTALELVVLTALGA